MAKVKMRRSPHLKLASGNFRRGDNFKMSNWHEVPDFKFALHTMAKVGVSTRPTPMTLREPNPG